MFDNLEGLFYKIWYEEKTPHEWQLALIHHLTRNVRRQVSLFKQLQTHISAINILPQSTAE